MSNASEKVTTPYTSLPKTAIDSELSEEEAKRALTSTLGFIDVKTATASFSEPNATSGVIRKNIEVTVPAGTRKVFLSLGDWDFSFGRPGYIERPLSHMLVGYGVNSFSGRLVTISVRALLRDINADDAWEANIEIVVACFG